MAAMASDEDSAMRAPVEQAQFDCFVMYYDEIQHRGRPHFQARYGEAEASIDIDLLIVIAGKLPTGGHTVHVRFEDGLTADVDLAYLRHYGGVFEPLADPDYFRRLRADPEAGTIVWPNQADIAPETLYAHARRRATPSG